MGRLRGKGTQPRVRWDAAAIDLMRREYAPGRSRDLAPLIGCTPGAVRAMAHKLGLARPLGSGRPWTTEEDALIGQFYGLATATELAARMPGRSVDSIKTHVRKLGIRRNENPRRLAVEDRRTIAALRALLAATLGMVSPAEAARAVGCRPDELRRRAIDEAMKVRWGWEHE